ncbi:MAG: LicD family protein [Bacteroidales bacterium]|nr:LicD family protein [Bacteroidales bacterium]
MKELTLREIQAQSLEILQAVHDHCIANGIKYSLAYGTLIGAIRHKGFIPWDDDVDIIMPRPDYERFVASFSAPGLGLVCEKDPDYYLNYCRVFDTVKTGSSTFLPIGKNYQGGMWIDVFPADGVSDDKEEFVRNIGEVKKNWMMQLRYRYSLASFRDILRTCGIKDFLILMAIKLSGQGRKKLDANNAVVRNNAVRIPYGNTEHWSQLCILDDGIRNYQLCEDFDETIDTEFEGRSFKIMKGYDRVLRNIYGDYMQLPPEEQRQPKHGHATLYWK